MIIARNKIIETSWSVLLTKAYIISRIVDMNFPIVNNWKPKKIISYLNIYPVIPIKATSIIRLISSLSKNESIK